MNKINLYSSNHANKKEGLGSYYWGHFRENESELTRLKKQARFGIEVLEKGLWREIPIKQDSIILDIGCGPGIISSELAKFCSEGCVLGIDKNELMIKECHNNKEYADIRNLSFEYGDICNLDIKENSVDVVYSRFLFQHLADPQRALDQVKRILKSNGIMCIIDVDDDWLTLQPRPASFESYLERVQKAQSDYGGDRFVGHKLEEFLKESGFKNIVSKVEMIDSRAINIKDLLDMTINYKFQIINKDDMEIAQNERNNILAIADNKFSWCAVGLFIAIGQV